MPISVSCSIIPLKLRETVGWRKNMTVSLGKAREETMRKWNAPRIIEIAVGMEINSYACATL